MICFSFHLLSYFNYPCSHSQQILFPFLILSQFFHHLCFAYISPITLPSKLHHSIFVLAQLQKRDLAVTNLLAKPPRAPCGGASSQRTHVIDWSWGKLCQAGYHDWISSLIINSLLPGTMGRHECHMVHFQDTCCLGILLWLIGISRWCFLLHIQYMSLYVCVIDHKLSMCFSKTESNSEEFLCSCNYEYLFKHEHAVVYSYSCWVCISNHS